jgi:hypothetical protein
MTYIVGIGKETDSTDYDGAHMVPTEGGFINLLQCKATTLIRVLERQISGLILEVAAYGAGSHLDVSELVVEVLERSVSTGGFSGRIRHPEKRLKTKGTRAVRVEDRYALFQTSTSRT